MKAYQIKYQHNGRDITYVLWKIAKTKQEAFKFAFGKTMPRNENKMLTKRGLPIVVTEVSDHEVSEIFPITPVPKEEPSKEVSNTGDDWML